ncbi:MAG: helix-turn-helix transcriptional regulator [Bdellovibrionales bacterium]|jgi:DNA-binding Xre family transcriptional regulator|nr:helix-turn-helix transcriptional regulator [Bdellovibrionales bacterium]MBT3527317.1 helix-turn-helix transcriptional regulator [Bdellovibrionales bacterium]
MNKFIESEIETFLGAVRKYMQVRGPMSQKDLAELAEVGVSTMSRFLNQKTTEINPQLIAKITAKLNIPLHEIIDFVDEEYQDHFIRLVKFIRGDIADRQQGAATPPPGPAPSPSPRDGLAEELSSTLGTAQTATTATIKVAGRQQKVVFEPDSSAKNSESSLQDKLQNLSPRQKAYLTDFLNLDIEGRDLMVDLGNALFRYFRQKGVNY